MELIESIEEREASYMGIVNGNILGERKEETKNRLSHTIIDDSID